MRGKVRTYKGIRGKEFKAEDAQTQRALRRETKEDRPFDFAQSKQECLWVQVGLLAGGSNPALRRRERN
jgi:hypothetical protein